VYFVGAEAVVKVTLKEGTNPSHYPTELSLIYEIIEISNPRLPAHDDSDSQYSARTIVLFIILPFGVAGLALYCALKFCIKKYRGMVPDNFVE
jgi:hypothetical protein